MKEYVAVVKQNTLIAENICAITLTLPEDVDVRGGQFVNLSTGNSKLLLRRPLGVMKHEGCDITLCYQLKGEGTRSISRLEKGKNVNVLMPLGNGFDIRPEEKDIVVIGGGVGIFPLISVIREHSDKNFHSFIGFRNKSCVCLLDELEKSSDLTVVTDDGSYGRRGNAVDAYVARADSVKADLIISCGPMVMLKALKQRLHDMNIATRCLVSLEERMGCGIGACLVCACEMIDGGVLRVCRDGPVFDVNDVKF